MLLAPYGSVISTRVLRDTSMNSKCVGFARYTQLIHNPVDTGRKSNEHNTFRRRPGRLLDVLCTFNLHPVSTGNCRLCYYN